MHVLSRYFDTTLILRLSIGDMKPVKSVTVVDDPQVHEDQYVHAVYDQIASHFSSTRYKVRIAVSNDLRRVNRVL